MRPVMHLRPAMRLYPVFRFAAMLAVACLAVFAATGETRAAPPPEPAGYRGEPYRGEVPASLKGATTIDTAGAHALREKGVAFIDVLPHTPRPANLPPGTIWRDRKRMSIPGSLWLPNVGYEKIAEQTRDYFASGLAEASGGDKAAPLVFFCLEECWMSWNAAKRALEELGYGNIYWYPDGSDGWAAAGHPLQEIKPRPE